MLAFQLNFCLGNISDGFSITESSEVSLKGNVYDFSVGYNLIDNILNIRKYLMSKKKCLALLYKCFLYY